MMTRKKEACDESHELLLSPLGFELKRKATNYQCHHMSLHRAYTIPLETIVRIDRISKLERKEANKQNYKVLVDHFINQMNDGGMRERLTHGADLLKDLVHLLPWDSLLYVIVKPKKRWLSAQICVGRGGVGMREFEHTVNQSLGQSSKRVRFSFLEHPQAFVNPFEPISKPHCHLHL